MSNINIVVALTDQEICKSYDVMSELRPGYTVEGYLAQVKKQMEIANFRIAMLSDSGVVHCVAGYRVTESLAWGKFMYVDDLVTSNKSRSRNFGKTMSDWLIAIAKEQQCTQFHLDSGVQRYSAHRFYLRERMDITCHHFMRAL